MRYDVWNAAMPPADAVNALVGGGYAPLTAMVLACRGLSNAQQAAQHLDCTAPLPDPYLLTDMCKAVARVRLALSRHEKIAIFGDYDVDGITSTCLLTDFLRRQGAECIPYIPGRLEEGYGLNPIAIGLLHDQGVKLIITVDCGITAIEEAQLCKTLGIDLIITDHHECKDTLPDAVAVIDPHRNDGGYVHKNLSGVGVAFKLASALCNCQEAVLHDYADMVCLGTIADVMPLLGENRVIVSRGLEALRTRARLGLAALMAECGCEPNTINASSVGYMLAPRINAAGRMGQIDLALTLFLTEDADEAQKAAKALCDLNRQRQAVESEIYNEALQMLGEGEQPEAIVLASKNWHQGVVGIVSSRIAEEYCCPTFLICLDGVHGKASSRSYGGFNLFGALSTLSPLLESYGGHESAAGFTVHCDNIDAFREQICDLVRQYYSGDTPCSALDADCIITPELLTMRGIDSLLALEPCGNGCPKPVLIMENLLVEKLSQVGGGRHMRLRLRNGRYGFNAIYFSATAESACIVQGDVVDVAFVPQVNEFRGERSVQMNLLDIRPSCSAACGADIGNYRSLVSGSLSKEQACALLPDRATLGTVWRYLACAQDLCFAQTPACLCRKIVRWSGAPLDTDKLLTCLDIFADVGLISVSRRHKNITICVHNTQEKTDLLQSQTMQRLFAAKES